LDDDGFTMHRSTRFTASRPVGCTPRCDTLRRCFPFPVTGGVLSGALQAFRSRFTPIALMSSRAFSE
jgi:hypothetical protein